MWSGSYGRCLFTTSQQHSSRTAPCSEAVTICPFALAEHDGRRTLYVNLKSQQTNSLDRNVVELTARDGDIEQRKVLCRSIESYAEEKGIEKIDVLKIDVQGLE